MFTVCGAALVYVFVLDFGPPDALKPGLRADTLR